MTNINYFILLNPLSGRMKGELEFLQGAFEAYKGTLVQDMEEKWAKKESDIKKNHFSLLKVIPQKTKFNIEYQLARPFVIFFISMNECRLSFFI